MREDAQSLTKALKGDSKTQGNWGELILEKILENTIFIFKNALINAKNARDIDPISGLV